MKSQPIHHHIPKEAGAPSCDQHTLITYRWAATEHPEKKNSRGIMHRLPATKSEGLLGKKTSQSSQFSLFVNLLPQYFLTYACLDVISGHIKENMVIQDGFTEVKSFLTNMIAFCHKITGYVDERSLVSPTLILEYSQMSPAASLHLTWSNSQHGWANY